MFSSFFPVKYVLKYLYFSGSSFISDHSTRHKPGNQCLHNVCVLAPSRLKGTPHCSAYNIENKVQARPHSLKASLFDSHTRFSLVSGGCALTRPIPPCKLLFPCSHPSPLELAVVRCRWVRRDGCVRPVGKRHHGDAVNSNVPSSCGPLARDWHRSKTSVICCFSSRITKH